MSKDYKENLMEELRCISIRINNMVNFLNNYENVKGISDEKLEAMVKQLGSMYRYRNSLRERIQFEMEEFK